MNSAKARYTAFVLLVLSSVGFFNYHGLFTPQISKLVFYLFVIVAAVLGLLDKQPKSDDSYPRVAYLMLMVGIAFSVVPATAFHPQSLPVSIMATLPYICAYACFWVLMKLRIPAHKIINTYIGLCAVSTLVYFINAATIPNNIFGEPIINKDISRGIVRLPVVFNEMFPLLVFYGINRFLITKQKKWLLLISWGLLMVILCVTRQIIAATVVLGAWFYFQRVSVGRKIALVLALMGIVVFVLPQIPIYKSMVELSEDQRDENEQEENIRITAWRYYTYENQDNAITPIVGNGVPSIGVSRWGIMFDSETEDNGCFGADVGWAGFYWNFGAIATLGLLILLLSAMLRRKTPDRQYLTYWIIYITLTSIASGPIVYYNWILSIMVVLYLIYGTGSVTSPEKSAEDSTDRDNAETRSAIQSLIHPYPQLPSRR